jgi:hypothetical protein
VAIAIDKLEGYHEEEGEGAEGRARGGKERLGLAVGGERQ